MARIRFGQPSQKITKEAGAHLGFFPYLLNLAGLGDSPGWFVG
jgi:hypothetical protein